MPSRRWDPRLGSQFDPCADCWPAYIGSTTCGGAADRLVWLYDIHLLAQRFTDESWQQVMTLVEERSLCGPCLDGLSAAQILLATVLPGRVLSRLRAGADREGFDPRQFRQRWRFEWLTFRAPALRHRASTLARSALVPRCRLPAKPIMAFKIHYVYPGIMGVRIVREYTSW